MGKHFEAKKDNNVVKMRYTGINNNCKPRNHAKVVIPSTSIRQF